MPGQCRYVALAPPRRAPAPPKPSPCPSHAPSYPLPGGDAQACQQWVQQLQELIAGNGPAAELRAFPTRTPRSHAQGPGSPGGAMPGSASPRCGAGAGSTASLSPLPLSPRGSPPLSPPQRAPPSSSRPTSRGVPAEAGLPIAPLRAAQTATAPDSSQVLLQQLPKSMHVSVAVSRGWHVNTGQQGLSRLKQLGPPPSEARHRERRLVSGPPANRLSCVKCVKLSPTMPSR